MTTKIIKSTKVGIFHSTKNIEPRPIKETRTCFTCGTQKTKSQFFDLYPHPALSFLGTEKTGVICSNCARKEMGKTLWDRYTGKT